MKYTGDVNQLKILGIAGGGIRTGDEAGVLSSKTLEFGHQLHWVSRLAGDALPEDDSPYDGLILFGGEISVADPQFASYFDAVAALVSKFDQVCKPVLGSCLGAQTLAYAFGGEVNPLGFSELGFAKLFPTPGVIGDPVLGNLTQEVALFEMHGDTFSLPAGATLLLEGKTVPNQAFRVGNQCYGFQCHFEATHRIALGWVERELRPDSRISPDELTATIARFGHEFEIHGAQQERFAATVIENWLTLCGATKTRREAGFQVS
jgi:GMP synthase (glutamine-hydrolysing)